MKSHAKFAAGPTATIGSHISISTAVVAAEKLMIQLICNAVMGLLNLKMHDAERMKLQSGHSSWQQIYTSNSPKHKLFFTIS